MLNAAPQSRLHETAQAAKATAAWAAAFSILELAHILGRGKFCPACVLLRAVADSRELEVYLYSLCTQEL